MIAAECMLNSLSQTLTTSAGKRPIMSQFMPNYALCHDEPNMPKIMLA